MQITMNILTNVLRSQFTENSKYTNYLIAPTYSVWMNKTSLTQKFWAIILQARFARAKLLGVQIVVGV